MNINANDFNFLPYNPASHPIATDVNFENLLLDDWTSSETVDSNDSLLYPTSGNPIGDVGSTGSSIGSNSPHLSLVSSGEEESKPNSPHSSTSSMADIIDTNLLNTEFLVSNTNSSSSSCADYFYGPIDMTLVSPDQVMLENSDQPAHLMMSMTTMPDTSCFDETEFSK